MDIRYVTNRLEIAFWQATIPLMRKRPPRYWPWLVLAFCALVLAGVGLASFTRRGAPVEKGASLAWLPGSQKDHLHKVLVLLVEELPARRPLLKGVWLVNNSAGQMEWKLSAIFPGSLKNSAVQDAYLVEAFSSSNFSARRKKPALGEDFQELLTARDLSWDGLVILDEAALAQLVDMMGGVGIAPYKMDGAQAVQIALASDAGNPVAGQAELIHKMCLQSPALFRKADLEAALDAVSGHLYTDIPLGLVKESWRDMKAFGYGVVCEFINAGNPTVMDSSRNLSGYSTGDIDANDQ